MGNGVEPCARTHPSCRKEQCSRWQVWPITIGTYPWFHSVAPKTEPQCCFLVSIRFCQVKHLLFSGGFLIPSSQILLCFKMNWWPARPCRFRVTSDFWLMQEVSVVWIAPMPACVQVHGTAPQPCLPISLCKKQCIEEETRSLGPNSELVSSFWFSLFKLFPLFLPCLAGSWLLPSTSKAARVRDFPSCPETRHYQLTCEYRRNSRRWDTATVGLKVPDNLVYAFDGQEMQLPNLWPYSSGVSPSRVSTVFRLRRLSTHTLCTSWFIAKQVAKCAHHRCIASAPSWVLPTYVGCRLLKRAFPLAKTFMHVARLQLCHVSATPRWELAVGYITFRSLPFRFFFFLSLRVLPRPSPSPTGPMFDPPRWYPWVCLVFFYRSWSLRLIGQFWSQAAMAFGLPRYSYSAIRC